MDPTRAVHVSKVLAACLAALSAGPALAGLGEDFGTRDPASCPVRTIPGKGAPSMPQVLRYLACDMEKIGDMGEFVYLLGEPLLEIAPKGRAYNPAADAPRDADPKQPVFDVHGYFRLYRCARKGSVSWGSNPGHACRFQEFSDAKGLCWKDVQAEWHCAMDYTWDIRRTVHDAAPPR